MPVARIDAEKETFCSATRNKAGRARERASAATSTQHSGAAERTPTDRRERKRTMAAAHLRLVCCSRPRIRSRCRAQLAEVAAIR